jgi:sortase A
MRMVVAKKSLRQILRWTQRLLFACGFFLLGYCGFVAVDAWMFERRANQQLEQRLDAERSVHAAAPRDESHAVPKAPPVVGPDGLIGRIEISRLGLSAIVLEGTDNKTLRHGVGHIRNTALPGQPGNAGLAAHRDTFFRPLKDIRQDDIIRVTTVNGDYRYRVVSTRVLNPTDVWVLKPTGTEILTLVTCHPFYFVGSAPNRFIVQAERVT